MDDSQWSRPPAFPDAGAGLVSTIDDYLAFGQMMLNEGKHGGERVLSRPSVEASGSAASSQVCRARLRRVRHGPKRAKRARQLRGEPPAAAGGDGGLGGIGSAQGA